MPAYNLFFALEPRNPAFFSLVRWSPNIYLFIYLFIYSFILSQEYNKKTRTQKLDKYVMWRGSPKETTNVTRI